MEIAVTRDTISVPSVRSELFTTGGVNMLYLEVAVFGEDTVKSFREAIQETNDNARGVLLDLRGNGGGYLPTAVELASFFLPENELVVKSLYTSYPDQEFRSK
ncbi:MAG: hypothetical protein H6765_07480 [Candidatus Peribacteria bacterium]|nr:MAG: hypothetical protein H6765_07480 [Candidatus Peribacteria bacterium]